MHISRRQSSARVAFGMSVVTMLIPAATQACSVCMGSSPADHGYFWGILLLMAMPFSVSGLIGGWFFYTYRRGHRGSLTIAPAVRRDGPRQGASSLPAMSGGGDRDPMSDGKTNGTNPAVWTPLQKESTN